MTSSAQSNRRSGYLVLAALLFALELMLGLGLIGITGGLAGAIGFSPGSRRPMRQRLALGLVFLALAVASFGWLLVIADTAKHNAVPVIRACKKFRAEQGRYPSSLNELVPALLPSIPPARYTLAGRKFAYAPERPELCFAAMFYGLFCYDFQTDRWVAND